MPAGAGAGGTGVVVTQMYTGVPDGAGVAVETEDGAKVGVGVEVVSGDLVGDGLTQNGGKQKGVGVRVAVGGVEVGTAVNMGVAVEVATDVVLAVGVLVGGKGVAVAHMYSLTIGKRSGPPKLSDSPM
jgi:hypothetical protein